MDDANKEVTTIKTKDENITFNYNTTATQEHIIGDAVPSFTNWEEVIFKANGTQENLTNAMTKDNRSFIPEQNTVKSFANWEEMILKGNETQIEEDLIEQTSPFNVLLTEMYDESQSISPNCTGINVPPFNDTGQNCTNASNCARRYLSSMCPTNIMTDNSSDCCISKYIIKTEPTQLGRNATYRTIFYWFSSVTFAFLPLILIATINCFLVNAVRKSQKERKKMTKSQVFSVNICYYLKVGQKEAKRNLGCFVCVTLQRCVICLYASQNGVYLSFFNDIQNV